MDLGGIQINGTAIQNAFNNTKRKINFNSPQSIYKGTNGLGNSVVNFSSELGLNVPFYLPAWTYNTKDGISGQGVLTFMTYQGKTTTHHLYHDLQNGIYFYVTRNGKNNGQGYESNTRRKLNWIMPSTTPNGLSSTNRYIDDATIGTDDKYEEKTDPTRINACVVRVQNPHLSKEDYMNAVYPSYDNPIARIASFNNAGISTFLNETVDNPKLTPNEDADSNNSPKSGATQNPKTNL